MRASLWTAACGLAVLLLPRTGAAEEPTSSLGACTGSINRSNVAACALIANPSLGEELASERAAQARREAARPFLPSNPTLAGSVASRVSSTDRAANWYLSIGQELEVGGQSWLRVEVADKALRAQHHRVAATRTSVTAQAWAAYFSVLAMQERLKLAAKLEAATGTVAATVRGMASSGLASEVDADVADAAALRASQDRLGLEAVLAAAKAQLNRLTGGPPAIVVEGVLEPLKGVIVALSAPTRLEVLALQEEHAALQRRVALLRREQVPNPTLSLYAQNDGFNERVLGVGLSVPIPLPQPIGRTRAGQLAETIALAQKAQAEIEGLQRELQAELTVASAEFEAASKARALYTAERIERAGVRLDAIAVQVKSARLPVRDALLAQQALVDQLKAHIDAREALCVASVRLRRAVGLSTEGDNL